jgi:hypothetical protein
MSNGEIKNPGFFVVASTDLEGAKIRLRRIRYQLERDDERHPWRFLQYGPKSIGPMAVGQGQVQQHGSRL